MSRHVLRSTSPGVALPIVGFGTYLISNDQARAAVVSAIAAGYRHIDTAGAYGNEAGVGDGVRDGLAAAGIGRDDVFVTTKVWPGHAAWGDPPKTYDQITPPSIRAWVRWGWTMSIST